MRVLVCGSREARELKLYRRGFIARARKVREMSGCSLCGYKWPKKNRSTPAYHCGCGEMLCVGCVFTGNHVKHLGGR
jgi:hypothetical protein